MHQKCSNYALTNLLFGLCRFMWEIDLLVNLPSPYPGAPAHPSTLEVLQVRRHAPTPYPSVVFTFRLVVESTKEFGGAWGKANETHQNVAKEVVQRNPTTFSTTHQKTPRTLTQSRAMNVYHDDDHEHVQLFDEVISTI